MLFFKKSEEENLNIKIYAVVEPEISGELDMLPNETEDKYNKRISEPVGIYPCVIIDNAELMGALYKKVVCKYRNNKADKRLYVLKTALAEAFLFGSPLSSYKHDVQNSKYLAQGEYDAYIYTSNGYVHLSEKQNSFSLSLDIIQALEEMDGVNVEYSYISYFKADIYESMINSPPTVSCLEADIANKISGKSQYLVKELYVVSSVGVKRQIALGNMDTAEKFFKKLGLPIIENTTKKSNSISIKNNCADMPIEKEAIIINSDPLVRDLYGTPSSSVEYSELYVQCADKLDPGLQQQINKSLGHLEN